jgi:carbamoyl-phosphate synthase small subunit
MNDTIKPQNTEWPDSANAVLLLDDGGIFFGRGFGREGLSSGEICFNTSMTGYQEIMTDPSYTGQIVTFTFPHIGNTGSNLCDYESAKVFAAGMVAAELPTPPSNWRSSEDFDTWLAAQGAGGIAQIDTRALVRHIRDAGAQNALIFYAETERPALTELQKHFKTMPQMAGQDLAATVTCGKAYQWTEGFWNPKTDAYDAVEIPDDAPHIVVVDYGVKRNILREIAARGAKITVVPANTSFDEISGLNPDGVLLSNGPGDPAATGTYAAPVVEKLLQTGLPVFGICLGHQILAIALGATTTKMPFGHRGGNHPVKNLETGQVEITSQNHGFCVLSETLAAGTTESHISLFDGTNEGLSHDDGRVFSVQYHPEASPGPQDSSYLFDRFLEQIACRRKQTQAA